MILIMNKKLTKNIANSLESANHLQITSPSHCNDNVEQINDNIVEQPIEVNENINHVHQVVDVPEINGMLIII